MKKYLSLKTIDPQLTKVPLSPRKSRPILTHSHNMISSHSNFHNFFWKYNLSRNSYFRKLGRSNQLSQPRKQIATPTIHLTITNYNIVVTLTIYFLKVMKRTGSQHRIRNYTLTVNSQLVGFRLPPSKELNVRTVAVILWFFLYLIIKDNTSD